jgi:hypothetical protein
MAFGRPFRRVELKASSPAIEGPCVYHGGFLKASAAGTAEVDVLDGNAAGQEPLDNFRAPASEHDVHAFDTGLYVMRGIFVNFVSNVGTFVLFYDLDEPEAVSVAREGP